MKSVLGLVVVVGLVLGAWFFAGGGAHQICLDAIVSSRDNAVTRLACKVTAGDIASQFGGAG